MKIVVEALEKKVLKEKHEGLLMMDCFNSMAPSDEELLRIALDGDILQSRAREHLDLCTSCRQRLSRYRWINSSMLAKLYRSQCPTATQLNYYCAGILSDNESTNIVYHVAECPLCAREIVDIRRTLNEFEAFPPIKSTSLPRNIIKRIIATSIPWEPQLVTRGASSDVRWPRQYCAEKINISLHLSWRSNGEAILLGLFTSEDPDVTTEELEGTPVDLYRAPGPTTSTYESEQTDGRRNELLSTRVDDLGNIVFKAISVGEYVMIARLPGSELVITGLVIEHGS